MAPRFPLTSADNDAIAASPPKALTDMDASPQAPQLPSPCFSTSILPSKVIVPPHPKP